MYTGERGRGYRPTEIPFEDNPLPPLPLPPLRSYHCDDYILNDNSSGDISLLQSLLEQVASQSYVESHTRSGRVMKPATQVLTRSQSRYYQLAHCVMIRVIVHCFTCLVLTLFSIKQTNSSPNPGVDYYMYRYNIICVSHSIMQSHLGFFSRTYWLSFPYKRHVYPPPPLPGWTW